MCFVLFVPVGLVQDLLINRFRVWKGGREGGHTPLDIGYMGMFCCSLGYGFQAFSLETGFTKH